MVQSESPDLQEPAYRWVIVTAAALMMGIALGQLVNGISPILVPLEQEFGWTRAGVSAINSWGLIGIATGGILIGFLADRVPVRSIALMGAVAISLATLLAARADQLWQFYSLYFVAGMLGGGAMFAPLVATVGGWFRTRAGLAIGIASAGQAVGQGAVPFGLGYLIEMAGWRGALTWLAVLTAATLIPLALLLRPPPATTAPAARPTQAAEAATPLLPPKLVIPALSLAVLGCCTGMSTPLIHLVPLIQGVCGVTAEAGGPLLVMLIAAVGGRVFFGALSDRIGPIQTWMITVSWQTALMMGFLLWGTLSAFYLFAPLYGFGYGGVMTAVLVTTRSLAPPGRAASSTGIVLAFGWLGHALGGWQGGAFFDLTGAYVASFGVATLAGAVNLTILGSLALVLVRRQSASAASP